MITSEGYNVRKVTLLDVLLSPAFRVGFRDIRDSRPWYKTYDLWAREDQDFYELGRFFAIYLRDKERIRIEGKTPYDFAMYMLPAVQEGYIE